MWLFLWFTGSQSKPDVGCRGQSSGAQKVPSGHAWKSLSPLGSGSPLLHRHHLVFSFLAAHPCPAYLPPPSLSLQVRPLHGLVPRGTIRGGSGEGMWKGPDGPQLWGTWAGGVARIAVNISCDATLWVNLSQVQTGRPPHHLRAQNLRDHKP